MRFAVAARIGDLPPGLSWGQVSGGAILCGIGFTMSLFIADLSFGGSEVFDTVRMAVLIGSLLSGVAGMLVLAVVGREAVAEREEAGSLTT
jgi:NhaA family Na+:H+ antiporter